MLTGLELGGAIAEAIRLKGVSKAAVARHFNIKGPSIYDWIKYGRVDKKHLTGLFDYFADVVGPEHWGVEGSGFIAQEAATDASDPVSPPATPEGYVRFNLFEGGAGLGLGVANADYPEVIRTVDIAEWQIRKKLGFLPAPGRMQLITGRGPSMRPKIEDGDVVMIDTSCTYFDGDDYYLISVDGEAQIKMLQKRVDGIYVVSSNSEFREWRIDPADLVVCGKALIGLGLRRL